MRQFYFVISESTLLNIAVQQATLEIKFVQIFGIRLTKFDPKYSIQKARGKRKDFLDAVYVHLFPI